MNPTSRKVKFMAAGGGVLFTGSHQLYTVINWIVLERGVPEEIATAAAQLAVGLIGFASTYIVGWLTKETVHFSTTKTEEN